MDIVIKWIAQIFYFHVYYLKGMFFFNS